MYMLLSSNITSFNATTFWQSCDLACRYRCKASTSSDTSTLLFWLPSSFSTIFRRLVDRPPDLHGVHRQTLAQLSSLFNPISRIADWDIPVYVIISPSLSGLNFLMA
jgi:hypothetical protein